ncbi:MAG: glycosyltransferase family 39 protein [Chloroflexi bacterium]|nr:glycosyltransferase family 39 protein [Chloroflexota bacterium]
MRAGSGSHSAFPNRIFPLAVLAPGAALRLLNLTWSSLDGDEGASLHLSSLSVGQLLREFMSTQLDPHPLGYYLLLKGWRALAGDSDLALRLLSALAGIALCALVYRLARALFDEFPTACFCRLPDYWHWPGYDVRPNGPDGRWPPSCWPECSTFRISTTRGRAPAALARCPSRRFTGFLTYTRASNGWRWVAPGCRLLRSGFC